MSEKAAAARPRLGLRPRARCGAPGALLTPAPQSLPALCRPSESTSRYAGSIERTLGVPSPPAAAAVRSRARSPASNACGRAKL
eukprot:363089-Chlamydomonas_euryale.AAC.7